MIKQNKTEHLNSGFSTKYKIEGGRLMNKDGSYNVKNTGFSFREMNNLYNFLLHSSWKVFLSFVIVHYFLGSVIFASMYLLIGIENLKGLSLNNQMDILWEAFFFSAQTLTTVGYEGIIPIGFAAQFLTMIESFLGILGLAIIAGIFYGRFSKPKIGIIYSENLLISPYKDGFGLMFKLANKLTNKVMDAKVSILVGQLKDGNRKFFTLNLEKHEIDFLVLSWTVVHEIDDKSPFFGMNKEDFVKSDVEFFINLKYYDETYISELKSTKSYIVDDLVWNAKFKLNFERSKDGSKTIHHLDKISQFDFLE